MKKLLFISNITNKITNFSYPSYIACKKMGIEFHLAANLDNFDFENNPYKDIIFHNIHCDRNPISPKNIKAFKSINEIIKEYKIDYIHCNTPIGGVLGRWCGHKNKVKKIIYTAHGFHFYKGAPLLNNIVYKTIERFLAHYTDILITMNEEDYQAAQRMKMRSHGKVYKVNGVGINVNEYQKHDVDVKAYRESLGLKEDDFVCIAMGDLIKRKNYPTAIKAIAECNNSKIHYLICGIGPEKNELILLTKQLKISKQVHFLGYRNDIKELLAISDCFLFSSIQEGLPRSLMEAMASGLPCIVSDIRGNCDLIEDYINGFLCRNKNQYCEKIKYLYDNYFTRQKMSTNNQKKIISYEEDEIIKTIFKIYTKDFG